MPTSYLLVVDALSFRDAAVTHQQTLVPSLKGRTPHHITPRQGKESMEGRKREEKGERK